MLVFNQIFRNIFLLILFTFATPIVCSQSIKANEKGFDRTLSSSEKSEKKRKKLSYFIYTADFINSFIEIPTSNVVVNSSTLASTYLAGRAPLYNTDGEKVGTCSASFLCMQNADGIFVDISNFLSVDNGLIISWLTPTTIANLELDTIVNSVVSQCLVTASTKIGFNPFYGKKFNMVVSSDSEKIYFKLYKI